MIRLVVMLDLDGNLSPRNVRERYLIALRDAIVRASCRGAISTEIAEELVAATPAPEAR